MRPNGHAGLFLVLAMGLAGCMAPLEAHRRMMERHMGGPMGPGGMGRFAAPPPEVAPAPTATPGGPATVRYRAEIQPIFDRRCVSCHGGAAGLWLDRYERVMAGSARGPVVVPGDPEASELYLRITGRRQPAMPLGGPSLPSEEIARIRRWIAEGAPNN